MELLKFPPKTPQYRQKRNHLDFICKLKDYLSSKDDFILPIKKELKKKHQIQEQDLKNIDSILALSNRRSTQYL